MKTGELALKIPRNRGEEEGVRIRMLRPRPCVEDKYL